MQTFPQRRRRPPPKSITHRPSTSDPSRAYAQSTGPKLRPPPPTKGSLRNDNTSLFHRHSTHQKMQRQTIKTPRAASTMAVKAVPPKRMARRRKGKCKPARAFETSERANLESVLPSHPIRALRSIRTKGRAANATRQNQKPFFLSPISQIIRNVRLEASESTKVHKWAIMWGGWTENVPMGGNDNVPSRNVSFCEGHVQIW